MHLAVSFTKHVGSSRKLHIFDTAIVLLDRSFEWQAVKNTNLINPCCSGVPLAYLLTVFREIVHHL